MKTLSVLADSVAQLAKVLDSQGTDDELSTVDPALLVQFHQGLLRMRTSLEAMQKTTTKRDRSPVRRPVKIADDVHCRCDVDTIEEITCTTCRKQYCRTCSYQYKEKSIEITSCLNCLSVIPLPFPKPKYRPHGCGYLYAKALMDRWETETTPK
jgi:hypothetical protein